ncbi:helix-turn-helix domain-containing protein [Phytohabitans flavus]|uniref:helix-turn-helix domain-containing protein n=1 Tax=Phytohabitans flavus TaxID=1076124 RepID=UPI00362C5303
MDTFGEALRRARRRAGLSLDTLEARVNFSKSYISKVENGRRPAAVSSPSIAIPRSTPAATWSRRTSRTLFSAVRRRLGR